MWQVGYQWVNSLAQMIMTDTILFDDKILKKVKEECHVTESGVTLKALEKLLWLTKVGDGIYILNTSFPGKIPAVSNEKNTSIKKAIYNLRIKAVSVELQHFLYFGGEGFMGLKNWANFGEDKEDSWLYRLEDTGKSL